MAWKWYQITDYKVSVGGKTGKYYGNVQLYGKDFYGVIQFHKEEMLPASIAPTTHGQRFYGHMDFRQMPVVVDLLRNEKPIRFGWYSKDPNRFHLMTGKEPVGEGEGIFFKEAEMVA